MKRLILFLSAFCSTIMIQAQIPVMVQDINTSSALNASPSIPYVYNGAIYFYANDSVHGTELWKYNEASPAALLSDITVGTAGSGPGNFTGNIATLNSKLYFVVDNITRHVLYAYDGTNPPTLAPGITTGLFISQPYELTTLANKIYFTAQDALGNGNTHIWVYNGTSAPTKLNTYQSTTSNHVPSQLTPLNGKLYYSAPDSPSNINKLYVLDPATNSFNLVTTSSYPNGFVSPSPAFVIGTKIYFFANDPSTGNEIYSYDGTTATRLTDLAAGALPGCRNPMAYYNGAIYFSGSVNGMTYQLYKLNTTTGVATLASTVNPTGDAAISDMFVYKDNLYFGASNPATGHEVWKFNGNIATMVSDLNPGVGNGVNSFLNQRNSLFNEFNGHLYFTGDDGVHGEELFRINDATGIENVAFTGQLNIYPNPVVTNATMDISLPAAQSLCITISDASGRQLFTTGSQRLSKGTNKITIPMQNFATGNYYYRIASAENKTMVSGTIGKQ
jgi:ELWxxDGT repeat protein